MGNNYPLLITLAEAGVLNQFILIGSWCIAPIFITLRKR